jgi:hypothetical protein
MRTNESGSQPRLSTDLDMLHGRLKGKSLTLAELKLRWPSLCAARRHRHPPRQLVAPEVALLQILTVFFLVILNGFFVASELAIFKVRDSQIASLANQGGQRGRIARHIIAHLDAYLSATQLGITLASLGLGWVGEPFIAHMLHPVFPLVGVQSEVVIKTTSFAIAFGIITFLHIVLGELGAEVPRHPPAGA